MRHVLPLVLYRSSSASLKRALWHLARARALLVRTCSLSPRPRSLRARRFGRKPGVQLIICARLLDRRSGISPPPLPSFADGAEQPDAVFRQYYCPDIDYRGSPPVITLPLGIHPKHNGGWNAAAEPPVSSSRPQVLAYLGSMTHPSRRNVAKLVSAVAESAKGPMAMGMDNTRHTKDNPIEGAAYQAVLWNAAFCPVPRGHAIETFRLNEARHLSTRRVLLFGGGRGGDTTWDTASLLCASRRLRDSVAAMQR